MRKTFIIAEAGANHNRDWDTAIKLIDTAYESGADAVKFQTFAKMWVFIDRVASKGAIIHQNLNLPILSLPSGFDVVEQNVRRVHYPMI